MIKKDLEKIDYPAVGECVYQTSLQNGLKLYLIPKADFNESYAIISTKFGSIDTRFTVDGVEGIKEFPAGIAHFLEHKLFEDQDGQDYLQHFVKLGAESNAFTSFTQTSYLFSTTSNVNENLRLLLEMTQSLHLSKDSLKKEQLIIQQEIEMYQDSPDYQLFFRALANLYPDTPLAQDIAGTVSSLSQIDEKSLQDNFDLFYQPSNMHLVVVGNFNLDSLVNLVSEFEMKTSSNPLPRISPVDLNPVVQNETSRMEVASPKLAIGIRGRNQISPLYQYRYKIILKLLIKGTSTAYVGDFANFCVGVCLVVPASIIYQKHKTKKNAFIGMLVGTLFMAVAGVVLNYFVMIPFYVKAFGMPLEAIIGAGAKIQPLVTNKLSFTIVCVAPFNIVKGIIVSLVTALIYKHISAFVKTIKL